jgi:ribosomal protein S18 acetylase RimI-like enzyme
MARSPQSGISLSQADQPICKAAPEDLSEVIRLLQNSFDHYADQLPPDYEVAAAIESGQILKLNCEGALAALLFFETTGLTSTLRYWAVAERFQSRGLGAALIRHYFAIHSTVRRFLLWVVLANQNALARYQHYGYAGDGLFDLVLVNERIHP